MSATDNTRTVAARRRPPLSPIHEHLGDAEAKLQALLDWVIGMADEHPAPCPCIPPMAREVGFHLFRIQQELEAVREAVNDELRQ